MNELIDYILACIDGGYDTELLFSELKIIQKLIKFIPSYQIDDAIASLIGGEEKNA